MKNVQKKCIPYLTGNFSKLQQYKKRHYGFKTYPYSNLLISLDKWTIYVSIIKYTRTIFKKKMYDEAQILYSSKNNISLT